MRARGSPHANTTLGPARARRRSARGGCVVLLHLHKSAGTSLLRPLGVHGVARRRARGCTTATPTSTRRRAASWRWRNGRASEEAAPAATHPRLDYDNAYLYFGGYCKRWRRRRRAQQRGCLRVAALREPVARLVSAMLYCARARPKVAYRAEDGGDVLCGNRSSGSPEEWAAHWGSYLWRQLALEPALFAALATCPRSGGGRRAGDAPCLRRTRAAGWRAGGRQVGGRRGGGRQAGWRRVRGSMDGAARFFGANDDGVSTAAGRSALRATVDRMRSGTLFDVVGIVEEWDDTMALFDALLPLSGGRRWASTAAAVTHGSAAGRPRSARRSRPRETVVAQWLRADAQLYEAARARFGVLVRRHVHIL